MASFTCPNGAICSEQARTTVGRGTQTVNTRGGGTAPITTGGTQIYHRTAVTLTKDGSGRVTGSERVVYIEKNGTWQPAAISKDGGKTYTFSDPEYPLMDGVAGADLQKDLKNPQGDIHKNVDSQVSQSLDKNPGTVKPGEKGVVVDSLKGQEQKGGTAGNADGQGSNPAANPQDQKNLEEIANSSNVDTRTSYKTLMKYPLGLQAEYQDCIKFSIVEYKASGLKSQEGEAGNRIVTLNADSNPELKDRKIIGTIVLPVPAGISDSNTINWQGDELDAISKDLANIAQSTITQGAEGGKNAVGETIEKTQNDIQNTQAFAASKFTQMASGAQRTLERQYGATTNTNMELLFTGPNLRSFSFTFKLTPRSKIEAKEVQRIIRTFKQSMSAQKSKGTLLLKAPNTFAISYVSGNKQHPYLNRFKECALTSCNVNYTPDGNYMTYDGKIDERSMTSYELQLQFQELVPLFNDDYGKDYDNIGF